MAEMLGVSGQAFRANNPCPMRQRQELGTVIVALPISPSAQIDGHLVAFISGTVSRRNFTPVYSIRQRGPPALV